MKTNELNAEIAVFGDFGALSRTTGTGEPMPIFSGMPKNGALTTLNDFG